MIELRDYQKQLLAETYAAIRSGKRRVLLQLATAGGKTTIFSQLIKDFTAKRPEYDRVLSVAHRVELVKQMSDRLGDMGVSNWQQQGSESKMPDYRVHALSIQTFASRRYQRPENVKLIIVDECHHLQKENTYGQLLEQYPDAYLIGVSATPIRTDGHGFGDVFEEIVCGPTVAQLMARGYLSDYKVFQGEVPDLKEVKTLAGDYKINQLSEACDTSYLIGDLVENYRRICDGASTIVFGCNVEHSLHISQQYLDAGIPAEHLDGKTPADVRQAILQRFKNGTTKVLCNFGIVTEGVDVPQCEAVQLARPTKSLALFLQMVGRGLRPYPGKDHAIILDHGGLIEEHGLPCDNRTWTLEGVKGQKSSTQLNSETKEVTPRESTPEERERNIIRLPGELKELAKEGRAEQIVLKLIAKQQQCGYKPGWVLFRLLEDYKNVLTIEHLKIYAKHMGYKRGWAQHKWNDFIQGNDESQAS